MRWCIQQSGQRLTRFDERVSVELCRSRSSPAFAGGGAQIEKPSTANSALCRGVAQDVVVANGGSDRLVENELDVALHPGFFRKEDNPGTDLGRGMVQTHQNDEADLVGKFSYNVDDDVRGVRDSLTVVAAIGEDVSDEGIQGAGSAQERPAAVAILNARGMQFEDERTSVCIHQGVALAPIDLLAGVVTPRTAGFRRLDAVAVDNRSGGTGFASNAFAVCHDKSVIDPLEDAGVAPGQRTSDRPCSMAASRRE